MRSFRELTDHRRTGKLEEDLANQFALGVNSYPYDLAKSTNIIINDKKYVNNPKHPVKESNNQRNIRRKNQIKSIIHPKGLYQSQVLQLW